MGRTLLALAERRSAQRYSGATALKYRLHREYGVQLGLGDLANLSTAGVLLHTADALPLGARVELFIPWPSQTDHAISIELYIAGRVVRHEPPATALVIDQYEFVYQRQGN